MSTKGLTGEEQRALLVSMLQSVLIDVEQIRDRPAQRLDPTYRNQLERPNDTRAFNMKDAQRRARAAATQLRKMWDMLEPMEYPGRDPF